MGGCIVPSAPVNEANLQKKSESCDNNPRLELEEYHNERVGRIIPRLPVNLVGQKRIGEFPAFENRQ
jgi:hypothetical protein